MAEIDIDLLEAVDARLATETASGQTLEDIKQYFVKFTESDIPPEFGSQDPILMVDMLTMEAEVISIPPCMTEKTYPIRFRVFKEQAGDTTKKTAAELIDLVEDVFYQQSFGLSEWVDTTSKDYTQPAAPPFETPYNSGATLVITHTHTDVRAVPVQA